MNYPDFNSKERQGDAVSPTKWNRPGKRRQRTVQLTVALVLFVAVIFAITFIKLPGWLPALK